MSKNWLIALAATLVITATAEARSTVNKSIKIGAGETVSDELSSVNGSVTVGSGAVLQDEASTVNGSLTIGDDVQAREISSVNGSVRIGDRATVDGDVSTVNGTLRAGESTIQGEVSTVNGTIKLNGSTVERDIMTVNGRITLDRGTRVAGNLIIKETRGRNNWSKPLKIELRGGSVVEGDVIVEDSDRKVEIRLLDGSSVGGKIEGADVVRD